MKVYKISSPHLNSYRKSGAQSKGLQRHENIAKTRSHFRYIQFIAELGKVSKQFFHEMIISECSGHFVKKIVLKPSLIRFKWAIIWIYLKCDFFFLAIFSCGYRPLL